MTNGPHCPGCRCLEHVAQVVPLLKCSCGHPEINGMTHTTLACWTPQPVPSSRHSQGGNDG